MTHVHEDIGAFVLGALDADGEKRVREHLAACPECAAAHAELAGIPGLLDLAVTTGATEEEPLPPAIEERLLDRFARERVERPERHRWRPRLAFGLSSALAGAAVAVALLVVGLNFEKDAGRPASQYRLAFDRSSTAPADAPRARRAAHRPRPERSSACGSTTCRPATSTRSSATRPAGARARARSASTPAATRT